MNNMIDELSLTKTELVKNIVGEIVLANNPESVIKKWRNLFKISQKELANELEITSSVISDYESGRRKSPGIKFIKKYIEALIRIDEKKGGRVIKSFSSTSYSRPISKAIVDIKEFVEGAEILDFCNSINARILIKGRLEKIYGYTIIDSVRAITELSFSELTKLYGITTQRALIFTNVSTGKGPLIAIKVTNLHPGLVVLHNLEKVDEIAINIAEAEGIPLAMCRLKSVNEIIEKLKNFK